MRHRSTFVVLAALVCALGGPSARAQSPERTPDSFPDPTLEPQQSDVAQPPHIELIDGVATVEHQGQSDRATLSQPLISGDRVRTERGRVEVMFGDGSFLYLDEVTSVEFLDRTLVRLTTGRATLIVRGQGDANTASSGYQVDTPAASIRTETPGEYRISTMNGRGVPETELAVVRGAAQLATDAGAMMVRAGERSAAIDNVAPQMPSPFNSARYDAFDRWIAQRQDAWLGSTSTQYLPDDMRMYAGAFDRYGTWGADPQYGTVWYPTVAPTWRPYYNGYWDYYPGSYGWFWIGADPWGWPTHHYGRWGFRSRWFWIPARRWAAAWVSWAISPGFVSWCPLGFDGRPVFGFYSARTRIGFDPWIAWTVVPRRTFGTRVFVERHVVDGRRLVGTERGSFIVQRAGPQPPPRTAYAVPRGTTSPGFNPGLATRGDRAADRRFDRGVIDPRANDAARTLQNRRATGAAPGPRGNPTRIDPPAERAGVPYYGAWGRNGGDRESPYDRAARVAAERRPGTGRQPLPQGDTSYSSPYPPQYRSTVPEPFRPRSGGPQYGNPNPQYDRAVPRGAGRPDGGAAPMPSPGARTAPGPGYGPSAQPRGGPGASPGRSPERAAPPQRGGGGGERAVPRGGGAAPRSGSGGNGGGGGNRRRGGD